MSKPLIANTIVVRLKHCVPQKDFILALLLGAVYPLGLAPLSWWPVSFLSIAGLLMHLHYTPSVRWFKLSYAYGLGYFGVGVSWVYVSIQQFGHAPIPLALLLTFIFIAFLALFKGLLGLSLHKVAKKFGAQWLFLGFPLLWALSDYLQGIFLTGFPWLYLGYALVDSPLRGFVPIFGVLGAGNVLVSIVSLFFLLLVNTRVSHKKRFIWPATLLAITLIPVIKPNIGYLGEPKQQEVSIALVQPNIDQNEKWKRERFFEFIKLYEDLTEPLWGADLIVWPEAAIPTLLQYAEPLVEKLQKRAMESGSTLIFGIPRKEQSSDQLFTSVVALNGTRQIYDKQYLVPFGEFVPFESVLRGLIGFFNLPMSSFTPGVDGQSPLISGELKLYPAICYEIAYSQHIEKLRKNVKKDNFEAIVTVSNDAWFGRSWGPLQHFQIAKSRALEFGIPVIRSTNTGVSAVINHAGKVLWEFDSFVQVSSHKRMELENQSTLFSALGFALGLIVMILFCLEIFFNIRKTL